MARQAGKTLGVLALALGLSCLCCSQTKTLTILHTNDTHSALLPSGLSRESGGIARMATLIKEIRSREKNVLALHSGDVFVGSFEFNKYLGYPELKIMETLYDAMSLGNHEFDLGLDTLAAVVGGQLGKDGPVTLPLLCANIDFTGVSTLSTMIRKSIIKTIDGVKIGIFGLVEENPVDYIDEVVSRFSNDVYTVAGAQAGALKHAGCMIVICLSHLGTTSDLAGLADKVPGIDIIVGGHSHDLFDNAVVRNGKIIVQAGSHGRFLGELRVNYEAGKGVSLVDWRVHPVDSRIKPDPRLEGPLNALRDGIVRDPRFGPVYSQIVAVAGPDIERDWPEMGQNRDTALGNLVTDAMRRALTDSGHHVDFALDALGYVADGIQAGKVVGNDVMRAVPYGYDPVSGLGFKLVVASMPGWLVLGGLEYSTSAVEHTRDLCIQTSGLTYAYDSSKKPAEDLTKLSRLDPMSVMVSGAHMAASPDKLYDVVMSEKVFSFLKNLVAPMGIVLKCEDTGIFEYNAVRDYMMSLRFVNYISEGRVKDTAAPAAAKIK